MDLNIREAIDSDAEVIAALLGELGYPTDATAVPGRLARMRADGGQWTFVAEANGQVVGMATVVVRHLISRDEPFGRLAAVVVKGGVRSRGIGGALLARAEEICREQGCSAMEVTSAKGRTRAHEFYLRHGFQELPKRFIKVL